MRTITGLAAPFGIPSTHPGRAFTLDPDGQYALVPDMPLVLEHPTSPNPIGTVDHIVTGPDGIEVEAVVDDDDLDLVGLAFSIEIAPWEMTQVDGVHVLTAGTIGAVALTRSPAFPCTEITVQP